MSLKICMHHHSSLSNIPNVGKNQITRKVTHNKQKRLPRYKKRKPTHAMPNTGENTAKGYLTDL